MRFPFWAIIGLACLLTSLSGEVWAGSESGDTPRRTLRILNWADYIEIDDAAEESLSIADRSPILKAFSERYGCEIIYREYHDTGEGRAIIGAMPGYFDLFCMTHVEARKLGGLDMLQAIDAQRLALFDPGAVSEIFPRLPGSYDYGVPYLAGTTGIVYRKDLVANLPATWKDFFDPDGTEDHKIGILSDPEVIFAFLLRAAGSAPESADAVAYERAASTLFELVQKEKIGLVSSDPDEAAQALREGRVAMTIHYSGDAVSMIEDNPDLGYYIPSDGGEVYVDLWTLPVGSREEDLAYAFIEFVSQPEISASNAAYLGYVTPVPEARKLLAERHPEHLKNPAIYPDRALREQLFPVNGEPALSGMYWRRVFP